MGLWQSRLPEITCFHYFLIDDHRGTAKKNVDSLRAECENTDFFFHHTKIRSLHNKTMVVTSLKKVATKSGGAKWR